MSSHSSPAAPPAGMAAPVSPAPTMGAAKSDGWGRTDTAVTATATAAPAVKGQP